MTRETDLAWLAGFIDGDGCFRLHHLRPNGPGRGCLSPRLAFSQKDRQVLDRVVEIVGRGKVHGPYHRAKGSHYQLIISGVATIELAKELYPYLQELKKAQVDDMVQRHKAFYELKAA